MEDFAIELHGEDYKVVLRRLHALLKPSSYLEIGSRDGSSLALASCASIAIDPVFNLTGSFFGSKPSCCLYAMGSDKFFAEFNPEQIFGREIDFAFLDGLHLAEFLLRDFINVERACKRNSVITVHDCIPLDAAMARRSESGPGEVRSARFPAWWTGDVWKVIPALRLFRPELQIMALDAQPTGLVMITGLDPLSTILSDHYSDIVRGFRELTDRDLVSFVESTEIVPTMALSTYEDISKYVWL
jgi:hypothetical protein